MKRFLIPSTLPDPWRSFPPREVHEDAPFGMAIEIPFAWIIASPYNRDFSITCILPEEVVQ